MALRKTIFGRLKVSELRTNLLAYYKMDTGFSNSTSSLYNGTGQGNIITMSAKIGNGSYFGYKTGSSIDLDVAAKSDFNFSDGINDVPFSISMWVKFESFALPSDGTSGNWIINKRTATNGGDAWQIAQYQGLFRFDKFDKLDRNIYQTVTFDSNLLNTNTWYHLVFVDNGTKSISGMKVFINGVSASLSDFSVGSYSGMNVNDSMVRIAAPAWNSLPGLSFNGIIDELGIWKNRALNQKDVKTLYNNGSGKTYPF